MIDLDDVAKFLTILAAISLSICVIAGAGFALSGGVNAVVYGIVLTLSGLIALGSGAAALIFRRIDTKKKNK